MTRVRPWNKIKADYLMGVTPKELALKYRVTAKAITEKASKEGWVDEKATIINNLQEKMQDKIASLTDLALETLKSVIESDDSLDKDKVSASKAILDISGLKSSKQEITGKGGEPLAIKKVFITQYDQQEADEHIKGMIDGD